MTKKDYIIIARAINLQRYARSNLNQLSVVITLNSLARGLSCKMEEDNKRFDRT